MDHYFGAECIIFPLYLKDNHRRLLSGFPHATTVAVLSLPELVDHYVFAFLGPTIFDGLKGI